MKSNKKASKLPLGFLIVAGIILTLCMGCFGFSVLREITTGTPLPTPDANIGITQNVESTQTTIFKSPTTPSLTASNGATATAPVTIPTLPSIATETEALIIIPITGGSCIPNNDPQTGRVVDVVDGDTIKVLLDRDGLIYSVRYIGMDTPENTSQIEYFGPEATAKNIELVSGKTVTLIKDVSEIDKYGRLLRYVLVDDIFVNYELVARGYANAVSYPPDISCIPTFQAAERQASIAKLGLWASPPTLVVVPTAVSSGGETTGNTPCNCSGPDLDCKDFRSHASAQACYEYCRNAGFGDVFRLDGNDNDGLACESLP